MSILIREVLELLGHQASASDLIAWRRRDLALRRVVRFGETDALQQSAANVLSWRMPVRRHRKMPLTQRIRRRLRNSLFRLRTRPAPART